MIKQYIFAFALLVALGGFTFTVIRIVNFFNLTRPAFPVRNWSKRFSIMLGIAFGQTRILRKPVMGPLHALVFWGFCVILFGSVEMVIDGLSGMEHSLKALGGLYNVITASGDIFALIVGIAIIVFLVRRFFLHIKRFEGIEMKAISHMDAKIALLMILYLMISLQGMNMANLGLQKLNPENASGVYPASRMLVHFFPAVSLTGMRILYEFFWWSHILMIFVFANVLPYSKHFHVFMSVPNVFLSRLEPLGKLPTMDHVTREVRHMLDPSVALAVTLPDAPVERFGIRDAEDLSWKNYLDSLACTECGRCTSVCPANLTGKRLSPRKIMMDARARMKQKGPGLVKNGRSYTDQKSLIRDLVTEEELWACTTCNACARECPISINQPILIIDMRRYLVMEEGSAPGLINTMFSNIENNGAPWQYSQDDRLLWVKDLEINNN
jgi:ferredoxin/nitrate reductase gamma subunit